MSSSLLLMSGGGGGSTVTGVAGDIANFSAGGALQDSGTLLSSLLSLSGGTMTGALSMTSGLAINWNADSGISRLGAASLAIGNGTNGDFTGSLKLKSILLTDTSANTDLTLQNTTAATAPTFTAPTLGAGATNVNAVASGSMPLSINVGDFVIIFASTSSATPPVVTDNGSTSNFYTRLGTLTNATWGNGYVFYCPAAQYAATTVTVTGSSYSTSGATLLNVSGVGAATVTGGSGTAASSAITTTGTNSLVVGAIMGSAATSAGTGGCTLLAHINSGTVPQGLLDIAAASPGATAIAGTTSGSWMTFAVELLGTQTGGANVSSPIMELSGAYWNGSTSATDAWTIQDIPATGSNPSSQLKFGYSGSSASPTVSFPQGSITPQSLPIVGGMIQTTTLIPGTPTGSQQISYAVNSVQVSPFRLEMGIIVNYIYAAQTVSESGKTFDVGIYSSAGVLLCNMGSQSCAGTSPVLAPTQGAVYLPPGTYYLAQTASTTAGCCSAVTGTVVGTIGSGGTLFGGLAQNVALASGSLPPLLGTVTRTHFISPIVAAFIN